MTRRVEVAPERLDRWLAGVVARHGEVVVTRSEGGARLHVEAVDGFVAVGERFDHDPLAVLLVRRGGYAVGLASAGRLVAYKVGTRHVQSRTAAGGWSQQRYARRRANQADALLDAVGDHLQRLVPEGSAVGLLVGGDRELVRRVLDGPAGGSLRDLPRRELWDLPDPRRQVLEEAVRRARAVRLELSDPPGDDPAAGPPAVDPPAVSD